MSRSGYSDNCDNVQLWRSAVKRAMTGYRGQAFLRKLRTALDAMPVKRLITNEIANEAGEVCAHGWMSKSSKTQVLSAWLRAGRAVGCSALCASFVLMTAPREGANESIYRR